MGMNAALPDRVRVIRRSTTLHKVHGEPQQAPPDRGPWIRCRLEDTGATKTNTAATEGANADTARSRFVKQPSILISAKDTSLKPVDLLPTDTLEVESREFGNDIWYFTGGVRAIRKKRRIHHYEASVARVIEG